MIKSDDWESCFSLVFWWNLPNSDSIFSGSNNPVLLWVESKLRILKINYWVDYTSSIIFKGRLLQVCNIPKVQFLVLSSCGNIFTWWIDGNCKNLWFMCLELESDGKVAVPNLEPSIPTNCNNVWLHCLGEGSEWGISNLTDPILMEMTGLSVFEFSHNIVQLCFSLSTSTNNLSVIWTHGTCENFLLVSNKSLLADTIQQVPES